MIPITKNIYVTDDLNREYEPTYLRRAKGLVKNGRARWVDENKICLACPPNIETEDTLMENIINNNLSEKEVVENKQPLQLNMNYVLVNIEKIINDNKHIQDALSSVVAMGVNESVNGGFGDAEKAKAITAAVQSRETTNQQLIKLLEKMYDDLKPRKAKTEEDVSLMQMLIESVNDLPPTDAREILREQLDKIC